MGLIISGIAACETIDSSGEILKIDGLDISSLERDGVFNWEHESKTASSIVGKILKAKKIFSDQDCVNESQKKYWKQVKVPFLWVLGELFDDVGHSEAMNIAAMIRYDMKAKAEGKYTEDMAQLINLSIEGAKLKKEGNIVSRSIARKVSITITPCNKVAAAEAHQPEQAAGGKSEKKGRLPSDLSIFKSETAVLPGADAFESLEKSDEEHVYHVKDKLDSRIHHKGGKWSTSYKDHTGKRRHKDRDNLEHAVAVIENTHGAKIDQDHADFKSFHEKTSSPLKKAGDVLPFQPRQKGPSVGKTRSGKDIGAPKDRLGYHKTFTADDHKDAYEAHMKAAGSTKDFKAAAAHRTAANFHHQSSQRTAPKAAAPAKMSQPAAKLAPHVSNMPRHIAAKSEMKKAMGLGSSAGAPSTLSGGAAVSKENLKPKIENLTKGEKHQLIGSAGSKEHLHKLVSDHFYSKNISFHDAGDGTHHVHNAKGKIEGVHVREHKGRWRFERKVDSDMKKAEAIREYNKQVDARWSTSASSWPSAPPPSPRRRSRRSPARS
jgi:hypothetical protein